MTIGEAQAVQHLLTRLLEPSGIDDELALGDAAFLADRSVRVLMTGRTGEGVRAAWPAPTAPAATAAPGRTGLVVPAGADRPVRTVTWSTGTLLDVVQRELGIDDPDAVEHLPHHLPDGSAIAAWVDDEAWLQAPRPPHNERVIRLLQLRAPLLGDVLITGEITGGDRPQTLGLTDAQVHALTELCAVTG